MENRQGLSIYSGTPRHFCISTVPGAPFPFSIRISHAATPPSRSASFRSLDSAIFDRGPPVISFEEFLPREQPDVVRILVQTRPFSPLIGTISWNTLQTIYVTILYDIHVMNVMNSYTCRVGLLIFAINNDSQLKISLKLQGAISMWLNRRLIILELVKPICRWIKFSSALTLSLASNCRYYKWLHPNPRFI